MNDKVGRANEMREANINPFVSALTAVSLLSFFALLGFLRLLTLKAQPIAEGTGWLRMISYLLVFFELSPFLYKKEKSNTCCMARLLTCHGLSGVFVP